jgi:hypothetical protein
MEEKWNLEGRFDILVTEICFVNLISYILSSNVILKMLDIVL